MNDFTKEELEEMLTAINLCHSFPSGVRERPPLIVKLRNMIDNYCEHDCKATIWQCQVTACSKCGYPSTLITAKDSLLPSGKGCIEASTEPA